MDSGHYARYLSLHLWLNERCNTFLAIVHVCGLWVCIVKSLSSHPRIELNLRTRPTPGDDSGVEGLGSTFTPDGPASSFDFSIIGGNWGAGPSSDRLRCLCCSIFGALCIRPMKPCASGPTV